MAVPGPVHSDPATGSGPVAPLRGWTRTLMHAGMACLGLSLLASLIVVGMKTSGVRLSLPVGCFLLSFALLKFAVGSDALRRLRAAQRGAPLGPDPILSHGSPAKVWVYIGYKYIAAAVAVGAAIYVLSAGSAQLDAFVLR